jgi:O-antigen/teichoic acid export membrane protein
MNSKGFFRGLSWLLALNLLVKPAWIFLVDRKVQLIVGHEAYGAYFAVLNLTIILSFLADAGLSNMLNQKMSSGESMDIGYLLRVKLVMLLAYAVICMVIGYAIGLHYWLLLIYTIAIQALTSLFLFLRAMITSQQLYRTDAFLSVLDKTAMIILCGGLIYLPLQFGGINLYLFLQIQTACIFVATGIAFLVVYQKKWLQPVTEKHTVRSMIRAVLPFSLTILLMALHYRLDGLLLERLHENGANEAGIYASAYRLLDAGNMLGYLSASFLLPFLSRNWSNRQLSGGVVLKVRHGLLLSGIMVATFSFVFAQWIMQRLYHTGDTYHADVLQWCLAALPGYFLVHIYGSVLAATHRLRLFMYILVASILLNTAINLMLIPEYGAKGACIAAIGSQYFCGMLVAYLASRRLQIPFHGISFLLYLLAAVLLIWLFQFARTTLLNVWIILAIGVLVTSVLLFSQAKRLKKYFVSIF